MSAPSAQGAARWSERFREIERTPMPANLDEFFRKSVAEHDDKLLVNCFEAGRTSTYAEVGEMTDRMTAALVSLDVQPGERVAVMMRSVPEFPATMFALARLGAVIVPTNFNYAVPEFDFVANDAGIVAAVIADEFCEKFAESETAARLGRDHVITVGGATSQVGQRWDDLPSELPSDHVLPKCDLDTPVSMQFTSGTTGFPKGCVLTHRYWMESAITLVGVLGPRYRILEDKPWFYMNGPGSFIQAMLVGGAVFMPNGSSLSRYMYWLMEQDIDNCWFPRQLFDQPATPVDRTHRLRDAWIWTATPALLEEIEERFGISGRDCYGMTEIGIGALVPPEDRALAMTGSSGVAAPFRELKIIDPNGRELPPGESGELCVRGRGILQGYHNRPEVNSELFIEGGWFRTGDLARIDEHGRLFYMNRIKDVIRRSGENVAALEVEHVLEQMPEIVRTAVVPVPDPHRDQEIKAYVRLKPSVKVTDDLVAAVLDWCGERLAAFKVPRYLEFREDLPMVPSGSKVSKAKLIGEKEDLRLNSYDRVDGVWR